MKTANWSLTGKRLCGFVLRQRAAEKLLGAFMSGWIIDILKDAVANGGPYCWVSPEDVGGIDRQEVLANNRKRWFLSVKEYRLLRDDEFARGHDPADVSLTEYLTDCLLERESLTAIPPELRITGRDYVEAVRYMICELGSSYASNMLQMYRDLIDETNASACLVCLQEEFEPAEPFIKDILRDFILEVFQFGELWYEEGKYKNVLTDAQNRFLRKIYDDLYYTYNNDDLRFFRDGSPRF
ncbi:hypothetical protein O4H49_02690 [Kiloniella laminariae]|uniref:Uncharacterized protein n=1 Tax=Kiloniella laminariae TaxID=454162 RepID=A0ABT4LF13_9PROT|nr:hypothetical protein [Kiloniella laminariae]MCZ4279669.1 hypothetical protein [Kiloniella laminariae]